jgi:hypothetical protein
LLKSDRAIQVNIAIMRAFVKPREILATHKEFALRLEELEQKLSGSGVSAKMREVGVLRH